MRRRPPSTSSTAGPAGLAVFVLEDWAEGPPDGSFARYEAALHAWMAARRIFEEETGWEGGPEWWAASHEAIVAMPDAPFDADDL